MTGPLSTHARTELSPRHAMARPALFPSYGDRPWASIALPRCGAKIDRSRALRVAFCVSRHYVCVCMLLRPHCFTPSQHRPAPPARQPGEPRRGVDGRRAPHALEHPAIIPGVAVGVAAAKVEPVDRR